MARRSNATTETSTDENNNIEEDENSNDDDKNEHRLARLALQCKSNFKKDKRKEASKGATPNFKRHEINGENQQK